MNEYQRRYSRIYGERSENESYDRFLLPGRRDLYLRIEAAALKNTELQDSLINDRTALAAEYTEKRGEL